VRLSKIYFIVGLFFVCRVAAFVNVIELHREFDVVVCKAQAVDKPLADRIVAINRAIEIMDTLHGEHLNSYRSSSFQGFAFGGVCIDEHVGGNAAIKSCLERIKSALVNYRTSISGATAASSAERIHELEEQVRVLQRRLAETARERERRP